MVLTIEFFIEDFWVHQCWKILHEKGEWRPRETAYLMIKPLYIVICHYF
jgi:hypothetical protein